MIASFSCQSADESTLTAIERVVALLDTRLADPDGLLSELLSDAAVVAQLRFDHVGMLLPQANGRQADEALDLLGFRVTEQFESTVIAGLLRGRCGQSDLRVSVTMAECIGDANVRLEAFCPENLHPDRYPALECLAQEVAHIAYRPVGDASFDGLCEAVQRLGFEPLMQGSNGNQRAVSGGSGVCLRYFVNPDSPLGRVKLEIVTPMIRTVPNPSPTTRRAEEHAAAFKSPTSPNT